MSARRVVHCTCAAPHACATHRIAPTTHAPQVVFRLSTSLDSEAPKYKKMVEDLGGVVTKSDVPAPHPAHPSPSPTPPSAAAAELATAQPAGALASAQPAAELAMAQPAAELATAQPAGAAGAESKSAQTPAGHAAPSLPQVCACVSVWVYHAHSVLLGRQSPHQLQAGGIGRGNRQRESVEGIGRQGGPHKREKGAASHSRPCSLHPTQCLA